MQTLIKILTLCPPTVNSSSKIKVPTSATPTPPTPTNEIEPILKKIKIDRPIVPTNTIEKNLKIEKAPVPENNGNAPEKTPPIIPRSPINKFKVESAHVPENIENAPEKTSPIIPRSPINKFKVESAPVPENIKIASEKNQPAVPLSPIEIEPLQVPKVIKTAPEKPQPIAPVSPIEKDLEPPSVPKISKTTPEKTQPTVAVSPKNLAPRIPQEIDVPDDGNCLLYAIAVGMKKKYAAFPEIQEKLNWSIHPDELSGNLKTKGELLKKPAETLRKQAANFLASNQNDDSIKTALIEGVLTHSKVAKGKIQDCESMIAILEDEINQLNRSGKLEPAILDQMENQIQSYHKEITIQKSKFPVDNLENIEEMELEPYIPQYIEETIKLGTYCGTAQIHALSQFYQVPIKILGNYTMKRFQSTP